MICHLSKDDLGITSIPLILFLVTGLTTFLLMLLGVYFLYDQLLDSCFMLFVFVCLWHCECVIKYSYLAWMQPFAIILQCIPKCWDMLRSLYKGWNADIMILTFQIWRNNEMFFLFKMINNAIWTLQKKKKLGGTKVDI